MLGWGRSCDIAICLTNRNIATTSPPPSISVVLSWLPWSVASSATNPPYFSLQPDRNRTNRQARPVVFQERGVWLRKSGPVCAGRFDRLLSRYRQTYRRCNNVHCDPSIPSRFRDFHTTVFFPSVKNYSGVPR